MRSSRNRNLVSALIAAGAFWWFLLVEVPLWFFWFPQVPDADDFTLYFAAARIGLEHGWSHIYDFQLQAAEFARLHPAGQAFDWRSYYITPPPMAWMVAPLTALPHAAAFYLWVALMLIVYLAVGLAVLPRTLTERLALVLSGLITFPLLSSLRFGNAALLVTLAVVGAWWCLRHNRPYAAGLLLSLLFLKPQTVYLVPLALFLWGDWRAPAAMAAALTVLALASVASLGPAGLSQWRDLSGQEPAHLQNQLWTAAVLVGPGPQALAAEAIVGGVALAVAWFSRGRSVDLPMAAALAGSLLAAPYHNASDGVVLIAAAWLYLETRPAAWHWGWLAVGLVAALLVPPWGPAPLMLFTAGWLVLMLWEAARPRLTSEPAVLPGG